MTAAKKVTLANKKGEKSAPLGQHVIKKVPIERIGEGQWVKPSWNPHIPFRKTYNGGAMHDPDYNIEPEDKEGEEDRPKMYTIGFARTLSEHQPEGTPYHVLFRDRRNHDRF